MLGAASFLLGNAFAFFGVFSENARSGRKALLAFALLWIPVAVLVFLGILRRLGYLTGW